MRSWYFPKPLIAGVHGFVGPEALKTIATFDFVLAAPGTRFSYEQARVRTSAPGGNPLVFLLPMRVWKKLILMGGWFSAEQALDFDFVQRVVAEPDLRAQVRAWAEHLAVMPSADVQIAKQGIHRQYELMGMLTMEMLHNRLPPPPAAQAEQFWDQVEPAATCAEGARRPRCRRRPGRHAGVIAMDALESTSSCSSCRPGSPAHTRASCSQTPAPG